MPFPSNMPPPTRSMTLIYEKWQTSAEIKINIFSTRSPKNKSLPIATVDELRVNSTNQKEENKYY